MRENILSLLVVIGLVACFTGCKHGIDEDLSNYKKPIITRINPEGIIYNNTGFILTVYGKNYENDKYVLYLNNSKFEKASPNYWGCMLSWTIPHDFLRKIINFAGNNEFKIEVRITPIQSDITGDFEKYADYISDVKELEVKRNSTNFTSPVKLFELWYNSTEPVLRTDSTGNLFLAWREKIGEIFQAFFCFSQDEGDTWSQVLNISRSSGNVTRVDMNSDGAGNFYMVWSEEKENSFDVYFSRSLDYGITWWNPRKMNEENENSINPCIEVDPTGKIFVTRTNYYPDRYDYDKIWLSTSSDRGDNWESVILIEDKSIDGESALKSGENGIIYLICGASLEGINCFFSTDSGSSWQVNQTGLFGYFSMGKYSSLRIGQAEKLFLIWNTIDTAGHHYNNWIHFVSGVNKGADWNEHQYMDHVCNTMGPKAAISVNGADINMLLHSGASLFLLRSTDEGETWSYPEFIPGTESLYRAPLDMVTGKTGKIYIVYIDKKDLGLGCIYFFRTQ